MPSFKPRQIELYRNFFMGPNPVPILDELLQPFTLDKSAKVLDLGCGRGVSSMHLALPFADNFFDAVISVDAYHYFGGNTAYYNAHIKKILGKGGPTGPKMCWPYGTRWIGGNPG